MYTRHQINEDTFAHRSLRWYCVLTDMAYLFSLRNSAIYIGMLTLPAQTSAHSFDHPPHPSDHRPSWSLCPLLQTLPPICSNPRLCYPSCHILGTYTRTRHLQLNTSSINRHSFVGSFRSIILLPPGVIHKPRPEYPPSATNSRRNCIIFLTYSPAQVLATTSAVTVAQLSSIERIDRYCV
jgi:hypothetical protein